MMLLVNPISRLTHHLVLCFTTKISLENKKKKWIKYFLILELIRSSQNSSLCHMQ